MGRQRNMSQRKGLEKFPEKELNEIEATEITDTEFKRIVTRMLKDLRGRRDGLGENLKRE